MNYLLNEHVRFLFHRISNSNKHLHSAHSLIVRGDPHSFPLLVELCQCSNNQRLPIKFFKNLSSYRFLNSEKSPTMQILNNLELKGLNCCLPPEINLNRQKKKNNPYFQFE
jgi:hypothetical protein